MRKELPVRSRTERLSIKAVVRLLERANGFNRLAKKCPPQHRTGFYELKDKALADAIAVGGDQFTVDSVTPWSPLTLGLTHGPSGRRVHLCPHRLPLETQVVLHAMAGRAGLPYPAPSGTDHAGLSSVLVSDEVGSIKETVV
jgi:hypothetical protein